MPRQQSRLHINGDAALIRRTDEIAIMRVRQLHTVHTLPKHKRVIVREAEALQISSDLFLCRNKPSGMRLDVTLGGHDDQATTSRPDSFKGHIIAKDDVAQTQTA